MNLFAKFMFNTYKNSPYSSMMGWIKFRMTASDYPRKFVLLAVFMAATAYGITFPYLSAQLEAWKTPGYLIGLNAAMPALGWLFGSLLMPWMQLRAETRTISVAALVLAALVWIGFGLFPDYLAWTAMRMVFGGAMGLFFRTVEFGLNATACSTARGRLFGDYNFAFGLGIAAGAAVQPLLGLNGFLPFALVSAVLCLSALPASLWRIEVAPFLMRGSFNAWRTVFMATPLPLFIGFSYGFLEDIPAYLFSIYALRNGLEADIAAYSLTAAVLGSISLPLLLGRYADRIGTKLALGVAAAGALAFFVVLPLTTRSPVLFLADIFMCGGFMSSLYTLCLTMIGLRWSGSGLSVANAAFGASYAMGGLLGPVLNGATIDLLQSNGLVVSAASVAFVVLVLVIFSKPHALPTAVAPGQHNGH